MQALLDVNVLIALLDAAHVYHCNARAWLEANIEQGWGIGDRPRFPANGNGNRGPSPISVSPISVSVTAVFGS